MKILALGDIHHPFADYEKLKKVYAAAKKLKPDAVVQIGDLYDKYSYSKFPRNPNFITPEEEDELGRKEAEAMWAELASTGAECYQLHGNHDLRPVRYAASVASMALHVLKKWLKEQMTFDDVDLVDPEFELDGVMFTHGDNFRRPGDQAKYNQQNSCVGHSHRPGIVYHQNKHGPFWELNCGWLGDTKSEAFSYRAQKKITQMIAGYGIIEDQQPRFILL